MTKFSFFLFLILFGLSACGSIQKSKDKTTYEKLENALLWEISGNKLENPSYLFGTIHIIHSDDFFYPEGLLTGLESSEKVIFEVDMNEMNDLGAQMRLMQKATMKGDLSLSDLLSPEDYEVVKEHFKKLGLPLMMFERLKPMFLTVFAGDMDPQGLQNGTMKSYEMELLKIANDSGKKVGGLETLDFQISVFDSIPYQEQADMLVEAIKMGDSDGDYLNELIQVYVDQDLNKMVEMFNEEGNEIEGHEDLLLGNRNRRWIPIMSTEMKEQPSFFAVGAGHLGGEDGVIHLLRKSGYDVKPVK